MPNIRRRSADDIRRDNQIKELRLEKDELEAKLEYVAIMTDVDIEEEDTQEAQNV